MHVYDMCGICIQVQMHTRVHKPLLMTQSITSDLNSSFSMSIVKKTIFFKFLWYARTFAAYTSFSDISIPNTRPPSPTLKAARMASTPNPLPRSKIASPSCISAAGNGFPVGIGLGMSRCLPRQWAIRLIYIYIIWCGNLIYGILVVFRHWHCVTHTRGHRYQPVPCMRSTSSPIISSSSCE